MGEEWQFDIVNNPTVITRTQYFEMVEMFQGRGPSSDSHRTDYQPPDPGPSAEELQWIAENAKRARNREIVELVRRETFRKFVVEYGLTIDEAFEKLVSQELATLRKLQHGSAGENDRMAAAYIVHNPLHDAEGFISRQGNRWCTKLRKDSQKAQAARQRSDSKREQSVSRSSDSITAVPRKPTPGGGGADMAISCLFMTIIMSLLGWLLYTWAKGFLFAG